MFRVISSLVLVLSSLTVFAQSVEDISGGSVQQPDDARQLSDIQLEAFVDGVMASYQAEHAAPGYTVSVVRSDRTVLSKGYGFANIQEAVAVDPFTTRFHVAS